MPVTRYFPPIIWLNGRACWESLAWVYRNAFSLRCWPGLNRLTASALFIAAKLSSACSGTLTHNRDFALVACSQKKFCAVIQLPNFT
jgi:hypothetical protein